MPSPHLPTGTVTFLFTDIEGSTALWERAPDAMRAALARHDAILRSAIESNRGAVFKAVGDGFYAVFATAPDAVAAALIAQQALQGEIWPEGIEALRVRAAIHAGEAERRGGDYLGQPLNRTAGLLAVGNGGQTLLTRAARARALQALPPEASLQDLGEHWLRDLGQPERVYELRHPALPFDFPPLRSLKNPRLLHNLPLQLTRFIGREREIAELSDLLAHSRLLTVTGSGGAGKTRLALQVAAGALDACTDGVWLVELAPLTDPALVAQSVAGVLGVSEQKGTPLLDTLRAHLKPKTLLLVLDNCEHLLDATAKLADSLLRSCPNVRILASSRESLGIGGERTYRIPSLTLPDLRSLRAPTAESLEQFESVRLLVDRARAVQPAFTLTDDRALAVAQLCVRLDGIPLAIELAAARVNALPVEEINGRLDNRFRLLTGGSRTALPRQQTLRALIDWSYDLLTPTEQRLLRRLSVFSGGWTLEAAEAVCIDGVDFPGDGAAIEEGEVLDLLTSLTDKSLTIVEEAGAGQTGMRYRLLETVRQYARDRLLESGEPDTVRDRHRDYFVDQAEQAEPELRGAHVKAWLDRLDADHDNLRAALEWSGGTPPGLRLVGALCRFWDLRGHGTEGRERAHAALALAPPDDRLTAPRGRALQAAGHLDALLGDIEIAVQECEEALALQRHFGDAIGAAGTLNELGGIALQQGEFDSARAYQEQALALQRTANHRVGIAASLNNLGRIAFMQTELDAAERYYLESLELHRESGDAKCQSDVFNNLGNIAFARGDFAAARDRYTECMALDRELGYRAGVGYSHLNLGIVSDLLGDRASARAHLEAALVIKRELGQKTGAALVLINLAGISTEQANFQAARSYLLEALATIVEIGARPLLAECLEAIGGFAVQTAAMDIAARVLGAAESLRTELGVQIPASDTESHAGRMTAARAALGDTAFDHAFSAGAGLSDSDLIALAAELPVR